MPAFLTGAVLGFLVAAPVGPIGLLCISRTIRAGWLAGFASGLGAATADCAYASLAAFGITAATRGAQSIAAPVHTIGAVLLLWMGIRELRAEPRGTMSPGAVPAPFRAFAGTFGLTLLNPATILSFIAIFAAASLATPSPRVAVQIVAGVFVGSAFWWLILASVTARVRRVAGPAVLRRINIASGFCLIAFALSAFFAR